MKSKELRVVCAWCKNPMDGRGPVDSKSETSHGICTACLKKVEADLEDFAPEKGAKQVKETSDIRMGIRGIVLSSLLEAASGGAISGLSGSGQLPSAGQPSRFKPSLKKKNRKKFKKS
jgi:hypothetical protein